MISTPITSPWLDLWADFHDPSMLWQLAALSLCIAIGWGLARALRGTFTANEAQLTVVRLGVESFSRVLWPLLALMLIVVTKQLLAPWYHVNLLRVAIPLLASFAMIRFGFYVLRRVFARGGQVGSFVLMFERIFAAVVWAGVALYSTGLWPDLVQFLDGVVIPAGRSKVSLLTILQAAVSVVITLLLALWASAMLEERLMQLDTMHSSLRAVMARMGRALLILIAVLASLSLVGIDLTVLSVFGGALGVGIGLGLQKIVGSYVSGFVILLERSLKVGDVVSVDKYFGKVTQINTRYTVLLGSDGVESVVPNEMLVSGTIQNYSLTSKTARLSTSLLVDYQNNIEHVLAVLQQAVLSVERVLKNPAPQALLVKFIGDGVELEIDFWISDLENGRSNILSDVNRALWSALQQHQITIPSPPREVRSVGEPKV